MPTPTDWNVMPDQLKRLWSTWAIVDLILCEQSCLRVYDFDPNWAAGRTLGKFDNGSGDHMFALFSQSGTVLKGFAHESPVSRHARPDDEPWPGLYDGLPESLWDALNDPALESEDVTFCLWRGPADAHWWRGLELRIDVDDGSDGLLGCLFTTTGEYIEWAEEYYERPIDTEAVALLLTGAAITPELIGRINSDRDVKAVMAELIECGLIASRI
jgi:hypothetical protein